ncbi:MAG: hypothetical protein NTY77_02545 [Elusimicrobia bacterium]|nr:hypothetical protein [Elusimicrobiota bacterium]
MRRRQHADSQRHRVYWLVTGGAFLMALVWQHVQATRLGYRVESARQHIIAMRCSNGALRMQLETLLAPANLSAQARGRLGMSLATPQSFRSLDGPTATVSRSGLLQRLISRTHRVLREWRTPALQARRLLGRRALAT